jgi:hypothetical protein
VLVSLIGRSFLSEVERPSILRTGLPVAPSLSYRLATGLSAHAPAQRAGAQRLRALPHANRSLMNRDALGSAQPTPLAEDRFSRFSPVHRADFEGQQRAESAPTKVASGRTGVRAKAAIPLRARNGLHRPKRTLISLVARSHRDWRDQRWPHSLPPSAGHRERLLHHGAMICKSSTRTATYCLLTTVVSSTATSPTTLTRMAAPALTAQ